MTTLAQAIRRGTTIAKPAAGDVDVGSLYYDTDLSRLQRSNGTDWEDCEPAAGGTGDVTWAIIQASQLANEVMNFPSLEGANDAQPEWWEKSANATLTEVDVAGEGITEQYARAHKVVTTADGSYSYQRYTYADQPRIKSGRKLSAIFAVWSVGGAAARIRLQSDVDSLGVSADTTAAGWAILKVEGVTLDGTYVEARCEVDSGTAYFVPLGVNIGERAVPLRPRGLSRRRAATNINAETLSGQASKAAADVDLTANTSPLAFFVDLQIQLVEGTSGEEYVYYTRPNGTNLAVTGDVATKRAGLRGAAGNFGINTFTERTDDQQVIETALVRIAGSGTIFTCILHVVGWWEWE
jgi:hypothetical protein